MPAHTQPGTPAGVPGPLEKPSPQEAGRDPKRAVPAGTVERNAEEGVPDGPVPPSLVGAPVFTAPLKGLWLGAG